MQTFATLLQTCFKIADKTQFILYTVTLFSFGTLKGDFSAFVSQLSNVLNVDLKDTALHNINGDKCYTVLTVR